MKLKDNAQILSRHQSYTDTVQYTYSILTSVTTKIQYRRIHTNVRITQHQGAFAKPLLQWKSNKHYILITLCVCACGSARLYARACSLVYQAFNVHASYLIICILSDSTAFFDIISQSARFSEKSYLK